MSPTSESSCLICKRISKPAPVAMATISWTLCVCGDVKKIFGVLIEEVPVLDID